MIRRVGILLAYVAIATGLFLYARESKRQACESILDNRRSSAAILTYALPQTLSDNPEAADRQRKFIGQVDRLLHKEIKVCNGTGIDTTIDFPPSRFLNPDPDAPGTTTTTPAESAAQQLTIQVINEQPCQPTAVAPVTRDEHPVPAATTTTTTTTRPPTLCLGGICF